MRLRFVGAARSEAGLVRENNEDAAFLGPHCLVVADGVGGGAAGEVASATTADAVRCRLRPTTDGAGPQEWLAAGVADAQKRLAAGVAADPERAGMATTLTAIAGDGERFALAHMGDSRGFLFRDGALRRLTRDHTWIAALVDDGRMSAEEASIHPWRNVVLRTVNGDTQDRPDLESLDLREYDRVLLASDGLTDLVSEAWIADILTESHDDESAVDALVGAALECGGRDNVTCVLASVVAVPEQEQESSGWAEGQLHGAALDPDLVVEPT